MKININDKDGKTYAKTLEKTEQNIFANKRIGDQVKGEIIGLTGASLTITGGSDKQGFPMRKTLKGVFRKKILTKKGIGFNDSQRGLRKKKSIRGNQITSDISQINLKVITNSKTPLKTIFKKEETKEPKKEEKK